MAQEPEVIQQDLEHTRHALAEKLEQIGEKISGTVETVSETVSSVSETVTNVTEAMEGTVQAVAESVSGTVESVKDTMESMGEKASETVEAVKGAFNVPEFVRRNPWLWVGGSVAAGFIAGKIFAPRTQHTPAASSFIHGSSNTYTQAMEPRAPLASHGNGYQHDESTDGKSEETSRGGLSSVLGGLTEHFAPELHKLQGLAVGTLFGVMRDMVAQAVPESLKQQVQGVFNDFTEKVGGKPIEGHVLDDSEESTNASADKGANDAKSSSTEMDRPLGTADRKSKEAVGKSGR